MGTSEFGLFDIKHQDSLTDVELLVSSGPVRTGWPVLCLLPVAQ